MIKSIWVNIKDRLPEDQGYYEVRFADGTEDEKWFRVRASKGIKGFMTMDEVTPVLFYVLSPLMLNVWQDNTYSNR